MSFQVSVIVPVYNAERYVRRAVESAVNLSDVGEVILIDDAGPDNSLEICRQLESEYSKVKLLQHSDLNNQGAGASRNLGIKNARFEFIAFLDADDYYLPNRFDKEKVIFTLNPTVDGVYGGIGVNYESEEAKKTFLEAGYAYQEFLTITAIVSPEELIEVLFYCHPTAKGEFHTIAITVRKTLFERSGLFNEKLRLRQDIHLWRRMAAIGKLTPGSIDRAVAVRGVHGANRMVNLEDQAKYVDYWWEDLDRWFRYTCGVPKRAKAAFNRAYCSYKVKNRDVWEGRRALLSYTIKNPRLVAEPMGFFDMNLLESFGRNWLTLHITSMKNRVLSNFR